MRHWIVSAVTAGMLAALMFVAMTQLQSAPPAVTAISASSAHMPSSGYQAAVQRTAPAVVSIRTAIAPRNANERLQMGLGSGVVLSADGYIVTNYHVIQAAEAIAVEVMDGRALPARLVGKDPETDLAVLKVDSTPLTPMAIAANQAQVGEIVLAIGYPFLLGQTVTQGIISATERLERGFIRLVQTDAAINRGNSGGALVNTAGELVGINSEVLPTQLGVQGIGFAIPVDLVQKIARQIVQNGRVIRGSIGFTGTGGAGDNRADAAHWQRNAVHVDAVDSTGSAAQAGMQAGDFITHFNGESIAGVTDLLQRVTETTPGSRVMLRVRRGEQELELPVTIDERH